MSEALTIPVQGTIVEKDSNVQVSAFTPDEMLHANGALIQWCVAKIASTHAEHIELDEAYAHAKQRKWKSDTLKVHAGKALKRVQFFQKMKAALEAGFYIVPTFPMSVFAVRTKKESPAKLFFVETSSWQPNPTKEQLAETLPLGEGEYKNPLPEVEVEKIDEDNGKPVWISQATSWEEMEFPLSMSKPQIMDATSRAMALKIFDEIGILEDGGQTHARRGRPRKGDPLILGRILDPRNTVYNRRFLTFIIAWHLDTKTL